MEKNWIPVKERLPEHDQVVLVVFDTCGIDWYKYPTNLHLANFFARNQYERFFRDAKSLFRLNSENITHWMALPEPPTV